MRGGGGFFFPWTFWHGFFSFWVQEYHESQHAAESTPTAYGCSALPPFNTSGVKKKTPFVTLDWLCERIKISTPLPFLIFVKRFLFFCVVGEKMGGGEENIR
eukprot:TRINITY_DN9442_c3_g2_i1.p1 TRINITY_DN9442_c3_g2~~TRINITY_DN9442_c3_g2_i1.p1  ORF type:complete len:102 (-),score=2.97 TRINITY_DN9442_c3_g2_i1:89-394(-)